ncbi:MAG: DUF2974 domain-containing protein [Eubacteriales bacterium]|nr:DUF2974 domain-containing protein [Eubacteriales bacterium]
MGNLLDYLAWRGDLPLERDPFNSVDALLLSCLSYVDFADVAPAMGEGKITLEEASERFFTLHSPEELAQDKSFINFAPSMLKALADSDRFKDAYILNYVNDTDISREIQFSAIEIDTSDGATFISFRGTDDTIIGWKEDFNLSFMTVPAEDEAVAYLKKVADGKNNTVRIGGHSKGGHLAVYSAALADDKLNSIIESIYNFDGPGFNRDATESENFRKIQGRIVKIIPESSIVGRLLFNATEPVIVRSNETGIMQHNPLSWQLEGKEFETRDFTDKISDLFDETMTKWLDEMSFEERKVFVDELFSVFEASGCENLSMLTKVGVKGTRAMIGRMKEIKNDSGEKVRTLMKMFFVNINILKDSVVKERLEESPIKLGIAANISKKNGKQ